MLNSWTWVGKLVLVLLSILLVVVVVPVLFVTNEDYPETPWWDVVGFLPSFLMIILGIGVVSESEKVNSTWKSHEIGVFFVLSAAVITCSAVGYADTQATLDQMQFTPLVNGQPVNLLAGSQAWNYSFTTDNYDDLLVSVGGYASAPCGTAARLHYAWAIYQDGTFMYGGEVDKSGVAGCSDDSSTDRSARSHYYLWNFKETGTFNISITFEGVSFPENSEESISFAIYGTTGFSGMWVRRDVIRFHYGFPLGTCSASVVIATLGLVVIEGDRFKKRRWRGVETVWKAPTSTPDRDLQGETD